MNKILSGMAILGMAAIVSACQASKDDTQPPSLQQVSRYGEINVQDPKLQIPDSVEPLFDHWLRDTYVNLGNDGFYYLTGTVGMPGKITAYDRSPGIKLWRSKDLKNWESMGVVWDFDKHATWQKDFYSANDNRTVDLNNNPISNQRRTLWAPEIHYLKSQKNYFIVASIPANPHGNGSFVLRSTTGEAAGPYENIAANSDGPLFPRIDGSLFEDDDGTVYFVGHNHEIARMKDDMSGLAEPMRTLDEQEYSRKPYIEGAYIFKANQKYHLVQAIWSFRMPDGSFAYDPGEPNDPTRVYPDRKDWAANRYSYDVVIATADNIYGPYSDRYTSVIGAGHNNFFMDKQGNWWATMFGNPRGDLLERKFLTRPAIIPMKMEGDQFFPDFSRKLD
ncbi:glycosyl hydrolase family 43 [Alteromonas aestuariivivens]|uniref:Glycosyl hydrolase family 43 n=1 Tax=Alteromonas aestuariivivens TaxID=1938339 RepID=A0A3D8MBU8_9ALTE|nr:family 43 glycosylhydrolase [Alteromonas aestuariivivens]RDV27984.1 glycosyl hydrolase family 43 [Alteromonas aestuariivivens]